MLQYSKVIPKPALIPMPESVETLGDHLRVVRVRRGLLQRDLAELFGMTELSVTNWENNRNAPDIALYPAIFQFLGYYPFTHETDSINGKFLQVRRCFGLGRQVFAKEYHLDYKTIVKWEETTIPPYGEWPKKIIELWEALPDYLKSHNPTSYDTNHSHPSPAFL